MRLAFYGRMSTDEQSSSIDSQRLLGNRFIADFGHTLAGEYIDEGIPGDATAEQRRDFQRLLADAAGDKYDGVLVRDTSRLTRSDSMDGAMELEALKRYGKPILTTTGMRIDLRTMEGRMMLAMGNEVSHGENRNRAVAVTNGQLHAALAGSWIGSPPYGYRVAGEKKAKRLVLVDETAAIVRRMFREYLAGSTGKEVARSLEGIPTPKGGPWTGNTITHILRNPAYCGDYVFNKIHYGKYQGIRSGKVAGDCTRGRNEEADLIIHRDHHPAIVSREAWELTQERLARYAPYKPPVDTFLLSSRLQCATCERPMWGRTMRSGSKVYICDECNATVQEREAVDRMLAALRFNRDELRELEEEVRGHAAPEPDAGQVERLERELARQKKKLVVLDADLLPPVQLEIRRLQRELAVSKGNRQAPRIDTARAVRDAMAELAALSELATEQPKEFRAYLLEAIGYYRVWVSSRDHGRQRRYSMDRGEIGWNFDTGQRQELKVHPRACVKIAVA